LEESEALPPALRWYCAPGKVFGCSRFFAVLVDLMRTKPGLEVSLGVSATTLFIPSTFLSWVSQTSNVQQGFPFFFGSLFFCSLFHIHVDSSGMSAFQHQAGSTLAEGPATQPQTWSTGEGTEFNVRCGPNYKKNGKKALGGPCFYELVGKNYIDRALF
jgi:hypothetical protein